MLELNLLNTGRGCGRCVAGAASSGGAVAGIRFRLKRSKELFKSTSYPFQVQCWDLRMQTSFDLGLHTLVKQGVSELTSCKLQSKPRLRSGFCDPPDTRLWVDVRVGVRVVAVGCRLGLARKRGLAVVDDRLEAVTCCSHLVAASTSKRSC